MPPLFPLESSPAPKVSVVLGQLPGYVASTEAPTKRAPWRTIRDVPCCTSATVMLPDDLYRTIWHAVEVEASLPKYAKVIMKLENVLSGDFFTEYIKKGNVLMLSEGEAGVDDIFSLRDGILRLELSKESYERAGLQGKPVPSGGRKHVKSRYVVEMNLRLPSMLHGKKGFDRLVWAAKNALNQSLNWLFMDLEADLEAQPSGPLHAYHPTVQALTCTKRELKQILTPTTMATTPASAISPVSEEAQESVYEILEYIDLLMLGSPRISAADDTDSFLSRYTVPACSASSSSVRTITWTGLISSKWLLELICSVIKQSRVKNLENVDPQQQWLALTASSFKTEAVHGIDGYTVLFQPHHDNPQRQHSADVEASPATEVNDTSMKGDDSGPAHPLEDVEMVSEDSIPTNAKQDTTEFVAQRPGFQDYLCAEYRDSLS